MQQAVLLYARILGARDVPTYSQYLASQKRLGKSFSDIVTKEKSAVGTISYQHDIAKIVARVSTRQF